MKTNLLFLHVILILLFLPKQTNACVDYDIDNYYFNLFAQEIIKDSRYFPFLMAEGSRFYNHVTTKKNANIEEWQHYLGLSYDDTRYLVFNAGRDDIKSLANGKDANDPKLGFITPTFIQHHKQALLYLAYAKYMEPYMCIINDPGEEVHWRGDADDQKSANQLDYNKVKSVLTRSWQAEKDQELKLRYGYQLVRFAHYNRKYEEAVELFHTFVEPLNFKPEMYYYALSQKAGALRGMGKIAQANIDFIQVFSHSNDLKVTAYSSIDMNFDNEIDFNEMLAIAKDDHERNDIYLMLGYRTFNNPLNEIRKIIITTPDAIQAKVLMARAINAIEREILPVRSYYEAQTGNDRYPIIQKTETKQFLETALALSSEIIPQAKDKNFWYMTTSYLCFLNKDFSSAKTYLASVNTKEKIYKQQQIQLAAYIDICEPPILTGKVENQLFEQHTDFFRNNPHSENDNSTSRFVKEVLSNRYFIQKEYAKAFLTTNKISAIEMNLRPHLLHHIEQFHLQKNKNKLETWLALSLEHPTYKTKDFLHYLNGILHLTKGDFLAANKRFKAADTDFRIVSDRIFGFNIRVWYSGEEKDVMHKAYLEAFPSIQETMSYTELTEALILLENMSKMDSETAAKACYLIGNFYYNVSSTGYFRHYLRFDNDNSYFSIKYGQFDEKESPIRYEYEEHSGTNNFILDYEYFSHFTNTTALAESYLQNALHKTKDDELKAHVLFTLSKVDQERIIGNLGYYDYNENAYYSQTYFDKLKKLSKTHLYQEVLQSCKYFNYYVNK